MAWLSDVATDGERHWDSGWLRASVLRCLPAIAPERAERAALVLADDADPVVVETAAWVLGR